MGDGPERLSPSYIMKKSRILESARGRYFTAIKELVRARKLEGQRQSG